MSDKILAMSLTNQMEKEVFDDMMLNIPKLCFTALAIFLRFRFEGTGLQGLQRKKWTRWELSIIMTQLR